jgi:hypothetical protein
VRARTSDTGPLTPGARQTSEIRVEFGPLGNASIVTVNWPSLRHGRVASTVQQSREQDRLALRDGQHPLKSVAVRDGQHPLKSDPGPQGIRNDWVSALLVAFQLVMLVLLLTGQIR